MENKANERQNITFLYIVYVCVYVCDCIACTNVYMVCLYLYTCVNFRVNTSRDFLQLKTITDCKLTKSFIAVEAYERCRCPAEPRLIGEPSL